MAKQRKNTASKKKCKKQIAMISSELSQKGCSANSFKSMRSYILGDLDISSNEDEQSEPETNSFEISSNSSDELKPTSPIMSSPQAKPMSSGLKQFQEDAMQPSNYLISDAFICKQSPFTMKNPIFFTCPNNKVAREIDVSKLQSKKQLFAKVECKPQMMQNNFVR
jgi:hypothetical protein